MKKNSLEKLRDSLQTLAPAIHLDPDVIERARKPIDRMLAVR
jgi:quinolinate synthase